VRAREHWFNLQAPLEFTLLSRFQVRGLHYRHLKRFSAELRSPRIEAETKPPPLDLRAESSRGTRSSRNLALRNFTRLRKRQATPTRSGQFFSSKRERGQLGRNKGMRGGGGVGREIGERLITAKAF